MKGQRRLPKGVVFWWKDYTVASYDPDILGWRVTGYERAWGDPTEIIKTFGEEWIEMRP